MTKGLSLLTRKPRRPHGHWAEVHAPLAHVVPGLRRYVQSHIGEERRRPDSPVTEVEIDGIAELWFAVHGQLEGSRVDAVDRCRSGMARVVSREVERLEAAHRIPDDAARGLGRLSCSARRPLTTARCALSAAAALWLCAAAAGCAQHAGGLSIATNAYGVPERIPATLSTPEGPGPFPAVVIMHDCSGLGPNSSGAPARWAATLVAQGHVVLVPDSFSTRGRPDGVCTETARGRGRVGPDVRAGDAYAALAFLRTLPYVDGRRVGLIGGSHGGSTTLSAMVEPAGGEALAAGRRAGFAAAVALYPRCGGAYGRWGADGSGLYAPVAPLLILIGEKDDWTPAEACRRLAEAARKAGLPVTLKVYPGAHHSFDNDRPVRYIATRVNPSVPSGRGATTGGDPAVWADSIREVVAFFALHLRPAPR